MTISLIPQEALNENSLNQHVKNLAIDFVASLEEAANEACLSWAEQTGMKDNVYMEDRLKEIILSSFIGFLVRTSPSPNQLSTAHMDAYFRILSEPNPPTKDPVED